MDGTATSQSLTTALGVEQGDVVAIVGGGGKTSALYRIGAELAARGWPALLSGTTRFTPPEHAPAPNLLLIDEEQGPAAIPSSGPCPLTLSAGHGSKGRLLPLSAEWIDAFHAARPDWTIVLEADGSAMRPFKAPAEHEPVIPTSATLVVPVVGLDCLGRPLDETHVHRPERVAALSGQPLGGPVTEATVLATLLHEQGGRKALPAGARWVPLLNKADTPERLAAAERIAARLLTAAERVVIARLRPEPPWLRVCER